MKYKVLLTKIQSIKKFRNVIVGAIIFYLVAFSATAQTNTSYFIYKVKKGQSFRSIASRFNLTAQRLADYNNIEFYEGAIAAKTLRIPKKTTKKDTTAVVKSTQNDDAVAATQGETSPAPGNSETVVTSPAPAVSDTQNSIPPIVSADTDSQEVNPDAEQPTIASDLKKYLPLIIFLTVGILLLAAAIVYYRAVHRK